jgi:hypothetical protein
MSEKSLKVGLYHAKPVFRYSFDLERFDKQINHLFDSNSPGTEMRF